MLGAQWFNLFLAEPITMTVFVTTLVHTWPNPPWGRLQVMGPVAAVVTPARWSGHRRRGSGALRGPLL